MSILKLLEDFTTEKLTTAPSSRRQMFGSMGSLGKRTAMAAGAQANPVSALQLALSYEYAVASFYKRGLESSILSNWPKAEAIYTQISMHKTAHVHLLKGALGDASFEAPEFDFTAGGNFDPFGIDGTNNAVAYAQFLIISQVLEDAGERVYKGQALNIMGNPDILTTALQIHSVTARHASEVRRLRGLKGWITGNQRGMNVPPIAQAVYVNEDNTTTEV